MCNHTIGINDRTVTDAHTGQDGGTDANPHFIFYHYRATVSSTAVIGIRVVINGDKVHFRGNEHSVANGNAATVEECASLLNPASFADADVLAVSGETIAPERSFSKISILLSAFNPDRSLRFLGVVRQ